MADTSAEADSPLLALLRDRIRAEGPMSVAEYMSLCLLHPQHGYYTRGTAFGAQGDFVTAPEITQMFGELVGLCLAQCWLDAGAPAPFALVELGPGRGSLMADLLRATRGVPGFHAAAQVHLVEASPSLRAEQAARITPHAPAPDRLQWQADLAGVPDLPLFLVANEFFDALPIRQFQRHEDGWAERMIGLQGHNLCLGLSQPAPLGALAHRLEDTRPGDIVETCAPAQAIAADLGARLMRDGGAALIVDYGDWRALGDTWQALRSHRPHSPLDTPGQADLTAHVDFEALAKAAACPHSRLTPQGAWLERLGLAQRAEALAAHLSGAALENHIAAFHRLTHPSEMGTLFKVIGLHGPHTPTPPGLDG